MLVAKDGKPWARLVPLDTESTPAAAQATAGSAATSRHRCASRPVVLLMAPSLLLDTHALLWWLVEPEKLSSLARIGSHRLCPHCICVAMW